MAIRSNHGSLCITNGMCSAIFDTGGNACPDFRVRSNKSNEEGAACAAPSVGFRMIARTVPVSYTPRWCRS